MAPSGVLASTLRMSMQEPTGVRIGMVSRKDDRREVERHDPDSQNFRLMAILKFRPGIAEIPSLR
ncbi:hypothetical protein AC244_05890 [Ensifer adhaerens]|uniref:Uncharacterized protein n=1 Tax=Ensifer adhaerens TaxID=106592 RepID=A0A0L8C239_ENSAD|nr:hypothetical protein AC244_05890 [Ensifer adhaerens]